MMDHTSFDQLFAELELFSPIIENSDLSEISYDSPSQDSFISPSNFPISSSKLRFVSQNAMKSNVLMHSLLNVSSSNPFSTDVILFQEPWYRRIGIDVTSGQDIFGTPSHRDWMCILPSFHNQTLDVAIYVPKTRNSWHVQSRSDLFAHPSIMAIDVITKQDTFLVINMYNPSDCSALGFLIHAILPHRKVIISGDFNLHHPLWSKPSHTSKISDNSELLVDSMSSKGFLPLNLPGMETFFRKDYSSVLDLTWISTPIAPHVSDFEVNFPMFAGSDHYPLTWSLSFSPLDDTPSNFLFHKDKHTDWVKTFKSELNSKWSFPLDNLDLPQFTSAVDIFMDAMVKTSMEICLRKPALLKQLDGLIKMSSMLSTS